jgi:hypothetical protein
LSDVEDDAVHGRDLVDDPRRDELDQVVRQARPVGGHRVLAGDGADRDRIAVGARVALHADRADRGQHAERLPQLAVEARLAHLLLQDRVGLAQRGEPLLGDVADDADREAGPRERLAPDHPLRHTELLADAAHLVLEEQPQRLDELHLHVGRQAADVVVRLDRLGDAVGAARLDHVGVERPLDEPRRRRASFASPRRRG